jgi:COMPASS component SWD2
MKDTLHVKGAGVGKLIFTHHSNTFLASASKNNWTDGIRYTSLYDHKDLRYFRGHQGPVLSLAMSRTADVFLSSGQDSTVRLWDLRSPLCQGLIRAPGPALVAADPQSTVFAVAGCGNTIQLLDQTKCERGAFATFTLDGPELEVHSVEFSADGTAITVAGTVSAKNPNPADVGRGCVMVIDSFEGKTLSRLSFDRPAALSPGAREAMGMPPAKPAPAAKFRPHASLSPDGGFLATGLASGAAAVWAVDSGERVVQFTHERRAAVTHTRWSPSRLLLASADANELAFWIPVV